MPISHTKKAFLLFSNRKPRWSDLTEDQKFDWREKALQIVYPDFRHKYSMHDEIVYTLAVALYECSIYVKEGGGPPSSIFKRQATIIDETEE